METNFVVNNVQDALRLAGVTENTLSAGEKESLDRQGYLILPEMLDQAGLAELRNIFEEGMARQREDKGYQGRQEQGTRHLSKLLDYYLRLEPIYTHPRILAAAYHVLQREFALASVTGRDPLPGYGQQGLHNDWGPRQPSEPYYGVNVIWMLDDFTAQSGATRVVPGSHTWWEKPGKGQGSAQPGTKHPGEIAVEAPAGSVLIFNIHLWHSGTENRSKGSRRGLFVFYKGREQRGYQPLCDSMEIELYEQLSPVAKYLVEG